ncbi:MAG: translation elongation factor Ts [Patescibacteria group bacterium]|jgi:elongation factor Ts
MNITLDLIQEFRRRTGMGVMDSKQALKDSDGDIDKAMATMRLRGDKISQKKEGRVTKQGLVESYVHANRRVGSLVVLLCESDFVARTDVFKNFAHEIALQVAATNPAYIAPEDVPDSVIEEEKEIYRQQIDASKPADIQTKIINGKIDKYFQDRCLLKQVFVRDDSVTIEGLLKQKIAELGENIKIQHIARFEI